MLEDPDYKAFTDKAQVMKAAAAAKLAGKKMQQAENDAVELWCQAEQARRLYKPFMQKLGRETKSDLVKTAPLKSMYRGMEKCAFRADTESRWGADCVCDIVRGMIQNDSMASLLAVLTALDESPEVEVLRVKDRFTEPTSGGWRDAMVNFRMVADKNNHVCELQLVHKQLMLVRQEMGGHHEYNVFRGALELLEASGKLRVTTL